MRRGGISRLVSLLMAGALPATAGAGGGNPDFDPVTGYRIAHYRSPVPPDVPGGKRVDADDIDQLLPKGALLVDVMPAEGPGYEPATGKWLGPTHQTIPGSTWLPDVGRGRIKPELDCFFRSELARLTGGDAAKPLVFFCQSDCWMAWNAVQRAHSYGYRALYWYPEGNDGWRDWDRKLAPATPVAVPQGLLDADTGACRAAPPR